MSGAADVYGQALYDLAREEEMSEGIGAQLEEIRGLLRDNGDYLRLLSSPGVPKAQRLELLDEAFRGRAHPYVLNFLKILTEKGLIARFPDCCETYRAAYNADHNILPVTAATAVPLTGEQMARLRVKLSKITGRMIELTNRVDGALLGGVRLDYDGKRVDDSVAGRIERLHSMLKNTAL